MGNRGNVVPLRSRTDDVQRPDTDSALVSTVTTWLHKTQAELGLSFEAWAKRSRVAPTVVSKFLRDGHPVPKMESLGKLADFAGTTLGAIFGERATPTGQSMVEIPLRLWEEELPTKRRVAVPERFSRCIGYIAHSTDLHLVGIMPGDLLVVDEEMDASPGHLLVWISNDDRMELGYHIGLLTSASRVEPRTLTPTWQPVALNKVTHIMGVVVHVMRDRPRIPA